MNGEKFPYRKEIKYRISLQKALLIEKRLAGLLVRDTYCGDDLNAVEDIKYFLDNRKPYVVQYLKEDFGLTGNPALVEVEINNTVAGSVIVNTVELTFDAKGISLQAVFEKVN